MSLMRWLISPGKAREARDTRALFRQVKALEARSPFVTDESIRQFVVDLIVDICDDRGVTPSGALGNALFSTIADFLITEGFVYRWDEDRPREGLTIEQGVQLRALLAKKKRFLEHHKLLLPLYRRKLQILLSGILGHFPLSAFADIDADGNALDDSLVLPSTAALSVCDNLALVVQRSLLTFFDEDVSDAHLFDGVRETLDRNARAVSGLDPNGYDGNITLPTENRTQDSAFLVSGYLGNTPLEGFFRSELPFAIPFPARFEHTHVIGGTGQGKSQLLQFLIHHDLVRAKGDNRSVIVIDSQGDLIRTVSQLQYFAGALADRYVMIDPTDIEHPVALNMFDFNRSRLSGYGPLDREKILNATVELYEFFFGALLGAELTQRQGLIFKYLARLLIEIPGATIHTLRELMENGEAFVPYMEKITGASRSFFATRFFDASFRETKKQILARLWGVLSNTALERMFSHKESKVDLFDLMNSGKIIFINTAKDLLGQDGAAIFGRFFIALISQAAIQRSAIPAHERNPCFVYIDEAQDYFDENIGNLLTQARKYKVGLVLAHQSLDQLGPELRGSVLANTTIKFAGGVSAKDATTVANELRTEPEFVLAQKRGQKQTHFACAVRNYTGTALSISIPLGFVESLPTLDPIDAEYLQEVNRAQYSAPPEVLPDLPFAIKKKDEPKPKETNAPPAPAEVKEPKASPEAPRPTSQNAVRVIPDSPGKGGQEHKYLQHLIKRLAEERGFRATVEESILNGEGQVDVALQRAKRRIACEISVTTTRDHELQNIEKCIAAGYTEIVLVSSTERHVKALAKFIDGNLAEGHGATIHYVSPEGLVAYLDGLTPAPETKESTVRGYKVTVKGQVLSPEERSRARSAVAKVIARSLRQSKPAET
jgi:hypothetical protein